GRIGPREFILHNVHEPNTPILMHSRWAMRYLRGPLTRPQISQPMANQRPAYTSVPVAEPSRQPATEGTVPQQPRTSLAAAASPPPPAQRPGAPPASQPAAPQPAAPAAASIAPQQAAPATPDPIAEREKPPE